MIRIFARILIGLMFISSNLGLSMDTGAVVADNECEICMDPKTVLYKPTCCDKKHGFCKECLRERKSYDREPTDAESMSGCKPEYACPSCRADWTGGADKIFLEGLDLSGFVAKSDPASRPVNVDNTLPFYVTRASCATIAAVSLVATLAYLYKYLAYSRNFGLIQKNLSSSYKTLLSFDFDMFGSTAMAHPLTKDRSVEQLCAPVQDAQLRMQLHDAIIVYEETFEAIYQKIISNYYYKPAEQFRQDETALVGKLDEAATQLKFTLEACSKETAPTWLGTSMAVAGLCVSGICGYYEAYANQNKKWFIL